MYFSQLELEMQNNSGKKSMNTVSDLDQVANKVKNNYIIIIYYKFKSKENIDIYLSSRIKLVK